MGGSRVVAGAAASCGVLNIQNQESAENDRVAPLMICVRSSFDSGAACVRLAGTRPKDFVSALAECFKKYCARGSVCDHIYERTVKVFIGRHNRERAQ